MFHYFRIYKSAVCIYHAISTALIIQSFYSPKQYRQNSNLQTFNINID